MRNLERIGINSEKLLKNEELIKLRGGEEDGGGTTTTFKCQDNIGNTLGCLTYPDCEEITQWLALEKCQLIYSECFSSKHKCGKVEDPCPVS